MEEKTSYSPIGMKRAKYCLETMLFLCILFVGLTINEGKITEVDPFSDQRISAAEIKAYMTSIMSQNKSFLSCPAPRLPVVDADCKLPVCTSDTDCPTRNQSCCFNGCILTCMDKMTPPPVIDWDGDITPPLLRREGEEVLRCTTTPRPAPSEPVGCPKGFVCKIQDYGDPFEKPFNSGVCVPDSPPTDVLSDAGYSGEAELKEKTSKQTVYLPGGCILSEVQYNEMMDFMKQPSVENCICVEGSVECRLSP